jgi:hypothetical protein
VNGNQPLQEKIEPVYHPDNPIVHNKGMNQLLKDLTINKTT